MERTLRLIILAAALSFTITVFLPHLGEEGVYSNSLLEMLQGGDYLNTKLYGTYFYRPPVYNWVALPLCKLFGQTYILPALRLTTAIVTLLTAYLVYLFTNYLFKNKTQSLFSTAIFLSGDLLLRRGWVVYADPLFSLLIFASFIFSYIGVDRKKYLFIFLSSVFIILAYLTKVYTAFIFYLVGLFCIFIFNKNRKFLLSPINLAFILLALASPYLWINYVTPHSGGITDTLAQTKIMTDINSIGSYLFKVIIKFPVMLIIAFLPASILAIAHFPKVSDTFGKCTFLFLTIFSIINLLPYWLAQKSHLRYILPLYPVIAIILGFIIYNSNEKIKKHTIYSLAGFVAIKYAIGIFWYPYELKTLKGNAYAAAIEILEITKDAPLYTNADTSAGLRVVAEINKIRAPLKALEIPNNNSKGYLLLSEYASPSNMTLIKNINMGKHGLKLFYSAHIDIKS